MKHYTKIIALTLVLLMSIVLFTACGAEKTGVEKIKESGKITMITNAAFPPFEYLGDDNNIAGVDVDIAQAIADELGVELEILNMEFNALVSALAGGRGDMVLAGMTITEERKQNIDFSMQYVTSSQYILVREDSDISGLSGLEGKVIGVQEGTTGDFYASGEYEENEAGEYVDTVKAKSVERYKTALDAGIALKGGKIDAVIVDELPGKAIIQNNSGLKMLSEKLTEEQYAIGIRKDNAALTEAVNKVLDELIKSGKIDEFLIKHS